MNKSIKALLAQQAATNIQQHRNADYAEEFDAGRQHIKIRLEKIDSSPFQPRLTFSEEKIRDLAESIAAIGLTQPVIVRAISNRYQLIAGERRLRAHRLLNRPTIEAIVVDADDGQSAAMALSENIDRADLSDFEIAEGIHRLKLQFPKRAHLAKALNLARSELYRYLAFHELPDETIDRLRKKPDLLGRRAVSDIAQAIKNTPSLVNRLHEALDLVETSKLEQSKIVVFLQQSANVSAKKFQTSKPIILKHGGARIGIIANTSTELVIKVLHKALPDEKSEKLQAFVQKLLEEHA